MRIQKLAVLGVFAAALLTVLHASPDKQDESAPQYNKDGELLRPQNYRQWVFLSSGFGMNYSKGADGMDHPMFTNVFVPQRPYNEFLKTGHWPDKTIFVVEERGVGTDVNPARKGQFQVESMGLGVEVKDSRFPEKWAYFGFGDKTASSKKAPKENLSFRKI